MQVRSFINTYQRIGMEFKPKSNINGRILHLIEKLKISSKEISSNSSRDIKELNSDKKIVSSFLRNYDKNSVLERPIGKLNLDAVSRGKIMSGEQLGKDQFKTIRDVYSKFGMIGKIKPPGKSATSLAVLLPTALTAKALTSPASPTSAPSIPESPTPTSPGSTPTSPTPSWSSISSMSSISLTRTRSMSPSLSPPPSPTGSILHRYEKRSIGDDKFTWVRKVMSPEEVKASFVFRQPQGEYKIWDGTVNSSGKTITPRIFGEPSHSVNLNNKNQADRIENYRQGSLKIQLESEAREKAEAAPCVVDERRKLQWNNQVMVK